MRKIFGIGVAYCLAACNSNASDAIQQDASSSVTDSSSDTQSLDASVGPMVDLQGLTAYIKASNAQAGDYFGQAVAISRDGQTLVVGADYEASSATGVDGDQSDNSIGQAGAAYVFVRSGASWVQQAYLKASNPSIGNHFGYAVSVSYDGNTIVVGAPEEDGCAIGVDGEQQTAQQCSEAGAVHVFQRNASTWVQQAYLKPSNTRSQHFGHSLALSADGNTLVVGGPGDDSTGRGVDGDQSGVSAPFSGAAYVFVRTGSIWSQKIFVKSSNSDPYDGFGSSVSISEDGTVIAVGAPGESSSAVGVGGSQFDNSKRESGAAYLFRSAGSSWAQWEYVKASNSDAFDAFGSAIALSGDGLTLAVGAYGEASAATGIAGNQADNSVRAAGAAYIFRKAATWAQEAYVKGARSGGLFFGNALALSSTGDVIVIGASSESGGGEGITLPQGEVQFSGVAEVFERTGMMWGHRYYIKATNAEDSDNFGVAVSVDATANSVAISARLEDSAATGVGGDQQNNAAPDSGAVYVYE